MTPDTQRLDEAVENAVEGTVGERVVSVVQSENPDESGMIRPFVVVDLRSALRSVRGGDTSVPGLDQAAEAASELTAEDTGEGDADSTTGDGGSGRRLLPRLFVAGAVLGAGYALRKRRRSNAPSPDEAAEEAAGETRSIAEKAASTIQQRGEVAASRIEEGTEVIAERIEERGDVAADQIEQTGQTVDEAESEAEDKVEDAKESAESEMGTSGDEDSEE